MGFFKCFKHINTELNCILFLNIYITKFFISILLDTIAIENALKSGIRKNLKLFPSGSVIKEFVEEDFEYFDLIKDLDVHLQAYAPKAFANLRKIYNVESDFETTFNESQILPMKNSGKSGSSMFYTDDWKFIIKTVEKNELVFFKAIIAKYLSHFKKYPNSLLPSFAGLYYVKLRNNNNKELNFVVMSNIYPQKLDRNVNKKYDLKGSGRKVVPDLDGSLTSKAFQLKEVDYENDYPSGIYLSPATYTKLMETLKIDINFLIELNVVDYSVLLVTDLKKKSASDQISRNSADQNVLKNGIVGRTTNFIADRQLTVYIGIIDILQVYTAKRQAEYYIGYTANILRYEHLTSILPSEQYGERLYDYASKFVSF